MVLDGCYIFSSVTITTLGYGDIVPINDLARTLVAVQSVLGIVLIGLFINAIGNDTKKARRQSGL